MDNQNDYGAAAYEKAIELLARRSHTSHELRRKLGLRKFPKQAIEEALVRLKQNGFLNDLDTARFYLEDLVSHKAWGYYGLLQKLMAKGITKEDAGRLLTEIVDPDSEIVIARKALRKMGNQKRSDKNRIVSYLKRKGFRNEIISRLAGDCPEG